MTVYNGMPYLEHSIDSVLSQSLEDFHFVIVDDGSTDVTADYLASLADPRIQILTQANQGTAAAANNGLRLVDTPFVARMDADDVAMKHRLATQLKFMQAHPDVGIVGAQIAPAGDKSVGRSLRLPTEHDEIFESMMSGTHGMAHSVIMIRTEVLKSLNGYWSLPLIDDWDMMLRVGEVSKLANLNEVLLHYRVHAGSLNGLNMKRMHRHIAYAIERAKHRQAGASAPSFEEFESELEKRPVWVRATENVHIYALANYRLAIAEIHGGNKLKGVTRLAFSACCSPARTWHRIARMLRGDSGKASAA